jgi:hypothetical protein
LRNENDDSKEEIKKERGTQKMVAARRQSRESVLKELSNARREEGKGMERIM